MTPDLPAWAAIPVALLVLAGAGLACAGSLGLLRLPSFYERAHAPTLGTSLGIAAIATASMVAFTVATGKLHLAELLVVAFTTVTTPVTLMLLARAALYRDRIERRDGPSGPGAATLPEKEAQGPRPPA